MGKINTEIFKSSFSKKNAAQYKLSILFGVDSLSYSVCSPSKELLVLKKINFGEKLSLFSLSKHLEDIFQQEENLSLPFQSVSIQWIAPHFTIIPNNLYSAEDIKQYLIPLREPIKEAEKYASDKLVSINSHLIYSIPAEIKQLLNNQFSRNYQLKHSFSSLIDEFSRQAGSGKEVFLNVRDYSLQAFFFDNKELIFVNQFTFQSEKDFLYYILLVYDQFKLNQTEVPLKIAGSLSTNSTIYNQLYRYVQHISFIDLPIIFQTDLDLKEHPQHLFFDVLHTA